MRLKGKIATSHDEAYLSTRAPQQELSTRRRRFFPAATTRDVISRCSEKA